MKLSKRIKNKKIDIFKYLSFFLILIFIFSIPTIIQKMIKIQKIECFTQYGECPNEFGLTSFLLSDYKIAKKGIEKNLDNNIQVNNYYKIPATIKIDLNVTKPKFAIKNSSNYYLVSSEGVVLNISSESNLPTLLKNDAKYDYGESISYEDKFALDIIEKVAWLYSVNSGLLENDLQIRLKEGVVVRFPLAGDVDTLIGSLRLIFSRLNDESQGIKMEDIKEIDLRFKSAILR